jgi:alginate O-acetyltransferase complex protein AlgI
MSYTIDVYRGRMRATHNCLHLMSYISLFPQLVAGPIVRAKDLMPALRTYHQPNEVERWNSFCLIVLGYFKKVVIADNLAPMIDRAFSSPTHEGMFLYWWLIAIMFGAQIYCDFSGYTDIARGVSNMMGYRLPLNFNKPYFSLGFRDFWSRWHISLSTWFRDYVYIPLGGSKSGYFKGHFNMWITMICSGIWHGAGWTFLFWGALHASFLSIERIVKWPNKFSSNTTMSIFGVLGTFALTTLAWVPFRSESMNQCIEIWIKMFQLESDSFDNVYQLLGYQGFIPLILLLLIEFRSIIKSKSPISDDLIEHLKPFAVGLMIFLCIQFRGTGKEFVYFQF